MSDAPGGHDDSADVEGVGSPGPDPNEQQEQLITSLDGPHLVDAGAGTGKTFAITRRYAHILDERDVTPEDILLVTFTRNAAAEMKDRIVQHSPYDMRELQDAPISTFHAYCYRLLRRYGHTTPEALGIDDQVPMSLDLVEDEVRESREFRIFMSQFADRHPEHAALLGIFRDQRTLRSLVGQLAAKGVIPKRDGWYRKSGDVLFGDREVFFETFDAANEPNEGARGPTNSDARSSVGTWDEYAYAPDAPTQADLHDDPQLNRDVVERAFDEDREALVSFVHDVYFEYLEFCLGRNYLTQGLMLALAFVLLCEDETTREAVAHEYVMVDEFQDTNELQFKIALLLASTDNICVVGDWKQSIYGFQYTSVENIQRFEERLHRYNAELNADEERLPYAVGSITEIPLIENYRSTRSILEFAEQSLFIPATGSEEIGTAAIVEQLVSLEPTNFVDNSTIAAYQVPESDNDDDAGHADEYDLLLDRIEHIVGNEEFAVEVDDEPQPGPDATDAEREAAEQERLDAPSYGDIAVFTRTRSFARELLDRAIRYDVPVAYEGGVELFDTNEAKLLLAWLRVAESDEPRGWAVVLERAGYAFDQVRERLDAASYPDDMVAFRDELQASESIGGLARRVFDRYGIENPYADALLDHLMGLYEESVLTRGEAIESLVDNLERGSTVEIDANPGIDAVRLQTIHGAKGLEYPIVILSNLNYRAFPHYGRPPSCPVVYEEPLGLRQRRVLEERDGNAYVHKHWPYSLLSSTLHSEYDEERRLLYVAMTRAKRHLLFTAGESPSRFITDLDTDLVEFDPEPSEGRPEPGTESLLEVSIPDASTLPVRRGVHAIMDESVYEEVTEGRGKEFGDALHDFAEAYVLGEDVSPDGADQERVATFIDGLDGELIAEESSLLPFGGEPPITLTGIIDLLQVESDRVRVIDYKTDLSRVAEDEYRKQLSAYYHVLTAAYPDREVSTHIFYTAEGELVEIEPHSETELASIAHDVLLSTLDEKSSSRTQAK